MRDLHYKDILQLKDTGETLLSSELAKYTTVRGENIKFDKEDLKALKTKFTCGLTLLGFKPANKIKYHLFIGPASFLYYEEEIVKGTATTIVLIDYGILNSMTVFSTGSRLLFGALVERCKKRGVVALCSLKTTSTAKPRIVALIPQLDEGKDSDQPVLNGFHIIYLPFLNDIRSLRYDELVGGSLVPAGDGTSRAERDIWRANREQIDAAKAIVKKMTMKSGYTPTLFENPALHTKWKVIEGMALQREDVEEVYDATMPDTESIDGRLGARATEFNELVFPIVYQPQTTCSRARGPENAGDVEEAARNGSVSIYIPLKS